MSLPGDDKILEKRTVIFDIKKIKNTWALKSVFRLQQVLDVICEYNNLKIVDKMVYDSSIIYMLTDSSYIAMETFPENKHLTFDLYITGHNHSDEDFECIFDFLCMAFEANSLFSNSQIIVR
jgi:S-adenosylmethionine/arginine decarboxylase-like enzyme